MNIRQTNASDLPQIFDIHQKAFGEEGDEIVGLVKALLNDPTAFPMLSLIAQVDGHPAGHILFTRVTIEDSEIRASILAPYPIEQKNAPAWMALELRPGILGTVSGTVTCADALSRPEYWVE